MKNGWLISHTFQRQKAVCTWRVYWICYPVKLVGWEKYKQIDADLVEKALRMALYQRQPTFGLLHHSDRGSQHASYLIRDILTANHIQVNMSGKGDCYDNAVMESFFGTLGMGSSPYQQPLRTRHWRVDQRTLPLHAQL